MEANNNSPASLSLIVDGKILESFSLIKQTTTLGRDNCDIILDDHEASGTHCKIQYLQNSYHIFDLNSTNGTFINKARIAKAKLNNKDKIKIGSTEFIFHDQATTKASDTKLSNDIIFDYKTLAEPKDKKAKEIDSLLASERKSLIANMKLCINATYSDNNRETLLISRELIIGRLTTEGQFNKDDEMSRKHARIFLDEEGNCVCEDLGSTNGVLVNGARINKNQMVNEDDVIKIGKTSIQVSAK